MYYDFEANSKLLYPKSDSISFAFKGTEMLDPEFVEGLYYDRELWLKMVNVLADAVGDEMHGVGDDQVYFWPEDDDDEEEEEWMGQDSTYTDRRLVDGNQSSPFMLWFYMWLTFEGYMNFNEKNYDFIVRNSIEFEERAVKFGQSVKDRDVKATNLCVDQMLNFLPLTMVGEYEKAVSNLLNLYHRVSRVYRSKISDMEYENAAVREMAGPTERAGAMLMQSGLFHQELGGRIRERFFVGEELEYQEIISQVFPCSYDHLREQFSKGWTNTCWTYGGSGAVDAPESIMDVYYGHFLRFKISVNLEKGASSQVDEIIRASEDRAEISLKRGPHLKSIAFSLFQILKVMCRDSSKSFREDIDKSKILKNLLVENFYQLKRMV